MTPNQRMARAHEIFAQVWGDDETGDNLHSVADEVMHELRNVADDFEVCVENIKGALKDAGETPLAEAAEFVEELDVILQEVNDIEAWLKPMRELADRLSEALAVRDAEARVA